jgi:hypothetical protein
MPRWVLWMRAHDPYYRITRRDPSRSPSLLIGVVAVILGLVMSHVVHSFWALALIVAGSLLVLELAARIVERGRARQNL